MDRPNDTNMLDTLTMIIEDEDNPTELINAARVVMKYPDVVDLRAPMQPSIVAQKFRELPDNTSVLVTAQFVSYGDDFHILEIHITHNRNKPNSIFIGNATIRDYLYEASSIDSIESAIRGGQAMVEDALERYLKENEYIDDEDDDGDDPKPPKVMPMPTAEDDDSEDEETEGVA